MRQYIVVIYKMLRFSNKFDDVIDKKKIRKIKLSIHSNINSGGIIQVGNNVDSENEKKHVSKNDELIKCN